MTMIAIAVIKAAAATVLLFGITGCLIAISLHLSNLGKSEEE